MDALLVPRKVTRLLLWLAGGGLGALAWLFLDIKLTALASTLAGSISMLCATAVWAMREKADGALGGEHLSADAFLVVRQKAAAVRRRSFWRAAFVALVALVAWTPLLSQQVIQAVWQWMVLAAGAATGEAAYSYLVAEAWQEDLRLEKDKQLVEIKRAAERAQLIERLERPSELLGHVGWASGPDVMLPEPHKH